MVWVVYSKTYDMIPDFISSTMGIRGVAEYMGMYEGDVLVE